MAGLAGIGHNRGGGGRMYAIVFDFDMDAAPALSKFVLE